MWWLGRPSKRRVRSRAGARWRNSASGQPPPNRVRAAHRANVLPCLPRAGRCAAALAAVIRPSRCGSEPLAVPTPAERRLQIVQWQKSWWLELARQLEPDRTRAVRAAPSAREYRVVPDPRTGCSRSEPSVLTPPVAGRAQRDAPRSPPGRSQRAASTRGSGPWEKITVPSPGAAPAGRRSARAPTWSGDSPPARRNAKIVQSGTSRRMSTVVRPS